MLQSDRVNSVSVQIFETNSAVREARTNEKVVFVFCDICSANDEGFRPSLEAQGWEINRNECFCPAHQWT